MRTIEELRAELAEWEAEQMAAGYCKRRHPKAPAPLTRDLLVATIAESKPFFTRLAKLILDSGEVPEMDTDKLRGWLADFRIAGMSTDNLVSLRALGYEMIIRNITRDIDPWRAESLLHWIYDLLSEREQIDLYGYTKEMLVYDYNEEYAKAKGLYEEWQQLQLQNSKDD